MTRSGRPSRGRRRSAARLAAVQALYQLDLAGGGAAAVVGEFNRYRLGGEVEGAQLIEADPELFGDLVLGVTRHRDDVDGALSDVLSAEWSLARLELLVRAILRAGAYEILFRPDIDAPLTISEYVDVAGSFFSRREPALINSVLDALAHTARPGVMSTDNAGDKATRPAPSSSGDGADVGADDAAGDGADGKTGAEVDEGAGDGEGAPGDAIEESR